ncbi:LysE family translocator [Pleomorphomonas sp. PLEO]|uniref:LysE family translocator n=1 Tax=Pleomorphomonas sp. PLEO TaxID=3239306 RepID=UPI00351E4C38
MPVLTLVFYTCALAVAAASPGPGMTAVVARALGGGFRAGMIFIAGIVFGDLFYLTLAIFGLASLAQEFHLAFLLIHYVGAAYLLYLAYKLWTSHPDPAEVAARVRSESPWRTVLGGFTLTLGNPKTIVFYMALLPSLMPIETITLTGYFELICVSIVTLSAVGVVYAAAAAGAREFFRSPKAMQRLNRTASAMMAGAAAAVVAR